MFEMFLQQMPPLEALCAISLFAIPMLVAVTIYTVIKRRRNRDVGQGISIWNIPPKGQAIVSGILFVVAAIYYLVTNEIQSGRMQSVNVIVALPYVFLGRDLGTLAFVAVGIFLLVLSLVRWLRSRFLS